MKSIILTLAMVLCFALQGLAQQSWYVKSPNKYLTEQSRIVSSDASACNKGAEPFKVFIKKFRADAKFRVARTKLSEIWEREMVKNTSPEKANPGKRTRCETYFTTYYGIQANEVCLYSTYENQCEEYGGGATWWRFQRIGGKWYVTGVQAAG